MEVQTGCCHLFVLKYIQNSHKLQHQLTGLFIFDTCQVLRLDFQKFHCLSLLGTSVHLAKILVQLLFEATLSEKIRNRPTPPCQKSYFVAFKLFN